MSAFNLSIQISHKRGNGLGIMSTMVDSFIRLRSPWPVRDILLGLVSGLQVLWITQILIIWVDSVGTASQVNRMEMYM